ncbi:hypothetical protein LV83_00785 [Algoriphagus yeomjeoni]|uniref:Uncharacterized protein n=1 Tax=Algoriphagus yeomjeoni TaxID=291403 RepID=A0A327PPB4_9BACT|nr:hypothetical protein LV83_00785 [Algoriphagus yeomjeoni]
MMPIDQNCLDFARPPDSGSGLLIAGERNVVVIEVEQIKPSNLSQKKGLLNIRRLGVG